MLTPAFDTRPTVIPCKNNRVFLNLSVTSCFRTVNWIPKAFKMTAHPQKKKTLDHATDATFHIWITLLSFKSNFDTS